MDPSWVRIKVCPIGKGWIFPIESYSFRMGLEPEQSYSIGRCLESRGTPLKFNSSPLKSYLPGRKGVFQPPFFRGELLNFGGVLGCPWYLVSNFRGNPSMDFDLEFTFPPKLTAGAWTSPFFRKMIIFQIIILVASRLVLVGYVPF